MALDYTPLSKKQVTKTDEEWNAFTNRLRVRIPEHCVVMMPLFAAIER
jgi:hypothetical protein